VTIKDIYEDRAGRMAARLAEEIRKSATQIVTGPYSPVIDRIADNHIRAIRISLRKDRNLKCSKAMLKNLIRDFEKDNRYDGHIVINADPS
jgi:hypothetical protein